MTAQIATLIEHPDNAAGKLSVMLPGRSVSGVDDNFKINWMIADGDETRTAPVIGDEIERAAAARQHHIAMIAEVGRTWKRIPSNHHHPQLESEPDD